MKTITYQVAQDMMKDGAVLIDIRALDEFNREHIAGAVCMGHLGLRDQQQYANQQVIFYCLSGMRTQSQKNQLANLPCQEAFILEGGLKAWQSVGLPTVADSKQPLPLQQQVQIGAGSLIIFAMLFGYFIHPAFFLIAVFVGSGLVFAGLTGFCGMAILLMKMPWNKHLQGSGQKSCSIE